MVGLMSVCKLIFLILWLFGLLIFTSCVKVPAYEFDLHLYQVDESLLDCPSGWLGFRNHCYFVIKQETTFQEADILCKRYGGYLVKIDGYNTNKGLGQLIRNHNISNVWIGLQRRKSGEFWWSDGELTAAQDGFWTNLSPIISEYDLCTVMNVTTSDYGDYRWTLSNCDIRYSSICQTSTCVAGQFRCSDGSGCISNSGICDGVYQCSDGSDEQICPGSCGGHLQGLLQTFHSPNYPQTYPKYTLCVWKLETPIGTRVRLKFESFIIEELYDKVIIHDGSSENDPLVGTYSGFILPKVPYSSSNFLLVIFQSDQDNQMSGFNASFSAVPKDECGSEVIASNLTEWLTSPNFPNFYPNSILCDWVIKSSNTVDLISLQFHSFSLDTSDFVEIRQGESIDSPLYGRYSGSIIPPVFISTSHSLFVRLYTDNTKASSGFNASYNAGCNNTILNGYARIMSPGFGITNYPNSKNCNWTVIDPEERNLTILFNHFDTEEFFDNVTVHLDDYSYNANGPVIPPAIPRGSKIFYVQFNPDSQVSRQGWFISVSYDCPALNLSNHLQKNSSMTTFGTYVLFSCDNGYQLFGTSILICDIGGRWSASPPTCKVIDCGSPTQPNNMALVSLDTTHYLGHAVYKCNRGYTMTSGNVSICQSNGQWSLPYCSELNCPKLVMMEGLRFISNTESHYVYGDIIKYNCDSNYRLIGASKVYCTENGTWSKLTPSCKPALCPPVYILNGYTNATDNISGGDYVHVQCNHGYTLNGSSVIHCGLNGIFSSLPSCLDINECETNVCGEHHCQNVPGSYRCVCNHGYQNPPDDQTVCTDIDECSYRLCNEICNNFDGRYRCDCVTGHHLYTEDTVRVVKKKVLWPNSTCIAKCPNFTVSNGGKVVADTDPLFTGEYIAPTTVSIYCPRGTIPDGSVSVECLLSGTWNDTVTTCLRQQCRQLISPSNGHVTLSSINRGYNSVAHYSCNDDYELIGVQNRFCQPINDTTQFQWTGSEPYCKEKMCPVLPDPANGQAIYTSTTIGSAMKYKCNCGYQLIGSQSRTCQPEGLWDGRNAICAPSSICQSPVTSSSITVSKVLPFYTVGSEVNFQCSKSGYQISDTALKCVIDRPTNHLRPKFNFVFEMKFLFSRFNQSCGKVYVDEIVKLFTNLVQDNCTSPKPSQKVMVDVKTGNVLEVDLTVELSEPDGGTFNSVCLCRSQLQQTVNTGAIQEKLNNYKLNGSGDTTCPAVRLKTVDHINITSHWSCDVGYEFVYSRDVCTADLEPVCYKSTDCPDIYVLPTSTTSTTVAPTTTDINVPISPVNVTTNEHKRTTTDSSEEETDDRLPSTSFSVETPSASNTEIVDKRTTDKTSMKYLPTGSSSVTTDTRGDTVYTTTPKPTIQDGNITTGTEVTSQKLSTVSVGMETTSDKQILVNNTDISTAIVQTTSGTTLPHVTSDPQTLGEVNSTSKPTTEAPFMDTTTAGTFFSTKEKTSHVTRETTSTDDGDDTTQTQTSEESSSPVSISPTPTENQIQINVSNSILSSSTTKSYIDISNTPTSLLNSLTLSDDFTTTHSLSKTDVYIEHSTVREDTSVIVATKTIGHFSSLTAENTPSTGDLKTVSTQTFLSNVSLTASVKSISELATQQLDVSTNYPYLTSSFTSTLEGMAVQTETLSTVIDTTAIDSDFIKFTLSSSDLPTETIGTDTTSHFSLLTPSTSEIDATSHYSQLIPSTLGIDTTTKDSAITTPTAIDTTVLGSFLTTSILSTMTSEETEIAVTSVDLSTLTTVELTTSKSQTSSTATNYEVSTATNYEVSTTKPSLELTTQPTETDTTTKDSSEFTTQASKDSSEFTTQAQETTTKDFYLTTDSQPTSEITTETHHVPDTTQKETKQTTFSLSEVTTVPTENKMTETSTKAITSLKTSTEATTRLTETKSITKESTTKPSTDFRTSPVVTEGTTESSTEVTANPTQADSTAHSPTSTETSSEVTVSPRILPKYVIQLYYVLLPLDLTEQCKTDINTQISSILSSTSEVRGALQNSSSCSGYKINVSIEIMIKIKSTAIEVTKTYGLGGQSQSILTSCGASIDQTLFSGLRDSLTDLPSQISCLQSLQTSEITISKWKCVDGYVLDNSGETCNTIIQSTVLPTTDTETTVSDTVTTTATTAVEVTSTTTTTTSSTTTTQSPTTSTSTKASTTVPTTTTTPGPTQAPTSKPFYLIQVAAVYTGTNLTWDGCINAMREQIEEKVNAVSQEIINGLSSWKQCSKQKDIILLTKTGKISVVPEKLDLLAPFAIQSNSEGTEAMEAVTSCATNAVEGHIRDKFDDMLGDVKPGVCFVTYTSFEITFSGWSCSDNYEYDQSTQICYLIQTTTSTTPTTSSNTFHMSNIKYFIPYGKLLLSLDSFGNVSVKDEAYCTAEYRRTLISMLESQTTVVNAGNQLNIVTNCPNIYISLYGTDVQTEDVTVSVSQHRVTSVIAVKLFATSDNVTSDGLEGCVGYLAGKFMEGYNALIGQSTIPASNKSQCSSVTISTVNFSNFFTDCTSGYQRASPNDAYFICFRGDRTKYIVPLMMSYLWLQPTNRECIKSSLMPALSSTSLDYVKQYAANPTCTSDIVLQHTNLTASILNSFTSANMTVIYELSSLTENVQPLVSCSDIVIRNAKAYFEQKLSGIFDSIVDNCGSSVPEVIMNNVSGFYECSDGKVWDQNTSQCTNPENATDIVNGNYTSEQEMSNYTSLSPDFTQTSQNNQSAQPNTETAPLTSTLPTVTESSYTTISLVTLKPLNSTLTTKPSDIFTTTKLQDTKLTTTKPSDTKTSNTESQYSKFSTTEPPDTTTNTEPPDTTTNTKPPDTTTNTKPPDTTTNTKPPDTTTNKKPPDTTTTATERSDRTTATELLYTTTTKPLDTTPTSEPPDTTTTTKSLYTTTTVTKPPTTTIITTEPSAISTSTSEPLDTTTTTTEAHVKTTTEPHITTVTTKPTNKTTTTEPTRTITAQEPADITTSITEPPVTSTNTTDLQDTATSTTKQPAKTSTTEPPDTTSTTEPPNTTTSTTEPTPTISTAEPPAITSNIEPPAATTNITEPPDITTSATEQPATTSTTEPSAPATTSTTELSATITSTTEPPSTTTSTTEPHATTTSATKQTSTTSTTEPPVTTSTTEPPAATKRTEPLDTTSTTEPPSTTASSTEPSATTTSSTEPPATTSATEPTATTSTTEPPDITTSTTEPPTTTNGTTEPPATTTSTTEPPVTSTSITAPPATTTSTTAPYTTTTSTTEPPATTTSTTEPTATTTSTTEPPATTTSTTEPPVTSTSITAPPATTTSTTAPYTTTTSTTEPPATTTSTTEPTATTTSTTEPPATTTSTTEPPATTTSTTEPPATTTRTTELPITSKTIEPPDTTTSTTEPPDTTTSSNEPPATTTGATDPLAITNTTEPLITTSTTEPPTTTSTTEPVDTTSITEPPATTTSTTEPPATTTSTTEPTAITTGTTESIITTSTTESPDTTTRSTEPTFTTTGATYPLATTNTTEPPITTSTKEPPATTTSTTEPPATTTSTTEPLSITTSTTIPPTTGTTEPPATTTSTTEPPVTTSSTTRPPATTTSTTEPPASTTSTTEPPDTITSTKELPDTTTSGTEPPATTTSATKSLAVTSTTEPPVTTSTTEQHATTSTTEPLDTNSTTEPLATITSTTEQPDTTTSTTEPPATSASTTEPPDITSTTEPPVITTSTIEPTARPTSTTKPSDTTTSNTKPTSIAITTELSDSKTTELSDSTVGKSSYTIPNTTESSSDVITTALDLSNTTPGTTEMFYITSITTTKPDKNTTTTEQPINSVTTTEPSDTRTTETHDKTTTTETPDTTIKTLDITTTTTEKPDTTTTATETPDTTTEKLDTTTTVETLVDTTTTTETLVDTTTTTQTLDTTTSTETLDTTTETLGTITETIDTTTKTETLDNTTTTTKESDAATTRKIPENATSTTEMFDTTTKTEPPNTTTTSQPFDTTVITKEPCSSTTTSKEQSVATATNTEPSDTTKDTKMSDPTIESSAITATFDTTTITSKLFTTIKSFTEPSHSTSTTLETSSISFTKSELSHTTEPSDTTYTTTELSDTTSTTTELSNTTSTTTEQSDTTSTTTEPSDPAYTTSLSSDKTSNSSAPSDTTSTTTEPSDTTSTTTEPPDTTSTTTEPSNTISTTNELSHTASTTTKLSDTTSTTTELSVTTSNTTELSHTASTTTEPSDTTPKTTKPYVSTIANTESSVSKITTTEQTVAKSTSREPDDTTEISTEPSFFTSTTIELSVTTSTITEPADTTTITEPADTTTTTEPADTTTNNTEPADTTTTTTEPADTTTTITKPANTTATTIEPADTTTTTTEPADTATTTTEPADTTTNTEPADTTTTSTEPADTTTTTSKAADTTSTTKEPADTTTTTTEPADTTTTTTKPADTKTNTEPADTTTTTTEPADTTTTTEPADTTTTTEPADTTTTTEPADTTTTTEPADTTTTTTEPADTTTTPTKPADTTTTTTEPADTTTTTTEPADTTTTPTEPADTTTTTTEPADTSTTSEPADTTTTTEPSDTTTTSTEPADTTTTSTEPADTTTSTTEPADTTTSTTEPADTTTTTTEPADTTTTTTEPADTTTTTTEPADTTTTTTKQADTTTTATEPADTTTTTTELSNSTSSIIKPSDTTSTTTDLVNTTTTTEPADITISTTEPADTTVTTMEPYFLTSTTSEPHDIMITTTESSVSTTNTTEPSVYTITTIKASYITNTDQAQDNMTVSETQESISVSQTLDNTTVSQTLYNTTVSQTLDITSVSQTLYNTTVPQTLDNTTVPQTLENTTVPQTLDNTTMLQTLDNTTVPQTLDKTLDNTTVPQTLDNITVLQTLDNNTVSQTLDNTTVSQILENTTVSQTLDNTSVSQTLDNTTTLQNTTSLQPSEGTTDVKIVSVTSTETTSSYTTQQEVYTTTQTTTSATEQPTCYICANAKSDASCNSIPQLCSQGSSCQTVVSYKNKKALISKKCVETQSCLSSSVTYPCDPTNYSTTCVYCCSSDLCNAETTFLEWQGKRKKRAATQIQRKKRSSTGHPLAFWNSSIPICIDMEPPIFQTCPHKDMFVYKESWGPVFVNVTIPTAVDNSGISPGVTVTPTDFRQPYLFGESTTVTFTAEDRSGNSAQCVIQVNLVDIYPLTITCPVDVVFVPYATVNDTVHIKYNNTGVSTTGSVTHITYYPPSGTAIRIKDHINVMATVYNASGDSISCNFTYEATRDDQLPEYTIKVVYTLPSVDTTPTCPEKYGSKLMWIFNNISFPECEDNFMMFPNIVQNHKERKLLVTVALTFSNLKVLDLEKMEHCGNLTTQKITSLGNITLDPPGCDKFTLTATPDETEQKFSCSNFTVFNSSRFCTYCPKGTFGNETSGACEVCPVNQTDVPAECSICSEGSESCLDTCNPGEFSPTAGLQPCTKCKVGTYTDSYKSTICQSCPTGKSTTETGTSSLAECHDECPVGQYSETGLVPCKPCPKMFFSNHTKSQSCIECPPGLVTTSEGSSSPSQCIDLPVCSLTDICNNGGVCVPVDSGRHFTCQCNPGFYGNLCEHDRQECSSGPCVNGICIDGIDSYSCNCNPGYTGYNCDTYIDSCSSVNCGYGTCIEGSDTCLCYDGFDGNLTCEEKNECNPDPCEHGGVCIDVIDDFVCNCTGTGYEGKNCGILSEKCYNSSCLNDGVCHPHTQGYSCSCAPGYTGDFCEVNIDDCDGHYCKNEAVCVDGINTYTCICQVMGQGKREISEKGDFKIYGSNGGCRCNPETKGIITRFEYPGFSGSQCNINIQCIDNPCVNKASCVTRETGFMCHCQSGYTGILCEVNIDECENSRCNPDRSTCEDEINRYTCQCLPGWTGMFCDDQIDECMSHPCAHGSVCTDLEYQFSCDCVDGYTGHNCSTDIDECRSSPCLNGGECNDNINGYTCICKNGFTGSQCQNCVDMCGSLPCENNGTCLSLVDTFSCNCVDGWTGQKCDTMVNSCLSLPCYNNATCQNAVNDFNCNCQPGYTGLHCQTDIDECVSDPCLHEGDCTNVIGGYSCTCRNGYAGPNCDVIDQPCPVCQNGGTDCNNGQCICLPGFVGPDCGKEREKLYDLYLHPNSSIETGVTRMKNRNYLSLCLWLKIISEESSTIVTLTAVDSDPPVQQDILSITTDSVHLSYFTELTIDYVLPRGSWNHICLTWNSEENGHWYLYNNGVLEKDGNGYGNGQELPASQKMLIGSDQTRSSDIFQGIISQLNMYDMVMNDTDISTGSKNCSFSMPSGTVFKWQEFSSYVSSGVEVIEPSLCGSDGCVSNQIGEFCNTTKDTEPPVVVECPDFVQVVATRRLNIVNWTEPKFSDNFEIVNIVQSHRSGQVFAYGEYDVIYIAYDGENNTAICTFTVYVIPSNCTMPVPPANVIVSCSSWSEGINCDVRCKNPTLYKFVQEIPPFYKCGREGFWDPPRGEVFSFPTCAESSQPAGTIKGEMIFRGPICSNNKKEILSQNFIKIMNRWNSDFDMCPNKVCNFSNITVSCLPTVRRRRRSTKRTYLVVFDIPVNGSIVSEGEDVLPLTKLETMVKNKEFNTENFSCDPDSVVVKPYVTCQLGQILVNRLCVNCARGTYYDNSSNSCLLCPRGEYTDIERQVTCQSCGSGRTTEDQGSSSSSLCYESCQVGNYFDKTTSECQPCDRGYYQDETGRMSCKSCGNGQTTHHTGSTSEIACQSTCRAGTELSVLGTCEPCVIGTYKSSDNQDSCQPCPYNYSTQKLGATSIDQCSVLSCPADYFYDVSAQKCRVCPPAYHQPTVGQNLCIPCTKFDTRPKCLTGEIDECALHEDNCHQYADCVDTTNSYECHCKFGHKGNGTFCVGKCEGTCDRSETCFIDNTGDPQCQANTSESLPIAALAGGVSSFVLVIMLVVSIFVCRRRRRKKTEERTNNYQTMDRVHRELEVVTYPRRIPVTGAFRTNPAYSDSELSDPTFLGSPGTLWPMFSDHHEDLSKYSETSLRRPLRLRITPAMKNEQHFEIESNKSWHDSSPGSSLSQYRDDSLPHNSSPNSSISKYRVNSDPKDSSPNSSISQYKEDSLNKNDSPLSNKSDFSDSFF